MFQVDVNRHKNMQYRKVGNTGLKMPLISLGMAYNFSEADYEKSKEIVLRAFNLGINHYDLSINFGAKTGAVEKMFGRILEDDLAPYRNEIIISTKIAPISDGIPTCSVASKKNVLQTVEESLKRLKTQYIDVLYIDGFDSECPLEETAAALKELINAKKVLYVGVCNFSAAQSKKAGEVFNKYDVPFIGDMVEYNIFNRAIEGEKLFDTVAQYGSVICYRPLAEGLLSNKYIKDAPIDSRSNKQGVGNLQASDLTVSIAAQLTKLNTIAAKRNQTISQMAISWVLRNENVPTVVLGVSKINQLTENIGAISKLTFDSGDLKTIDKEIKR